MGLERSSDVVPTEPVGQPGNGEELARAVKPFGIAKRVVWEAYRHVKANQGAAGIDGESIEMFEANLNSNLYRQLSARGELGGDQEDAVHDQELEAVETNPGRH